MVAGGRDAWCALQDATGALADARSERRMCAAWRRRHLPPFRMGLARLRMHLRARKEHLRACESRLAASQGRFAAIRHHRGVTDPHVITPALRHAYPPMCAVSPEGGYSNPGCAEVFFTSACPASISQLPSAVFIILLRSVLRAFLALVRFFRRLNPWCRVPGVPGAGGAGAGCRGASSEALSAGSAGRLSGI